MANFNGKSPVPTSQLKDLGAYGTYGLAGNVKEWIWNATDERRYLVGGAWNDPPTWRPTAKRGRRSIGVRLTVSLRPGHFDAAGRCPGGDRSARGRADGWTNRSATNCTRLTRRCMRTIRRPLDPRVESASRTRITGARSVSRSPRHTGTSGCRSTSAAEERHAALSGRRMVSRRIRRSLLSRRRRPGHDAVHSIFPASGRALVFPIYQGMFERFAGTTDYPQADQMNAYRDMAIQWSKDLGRTIDYLETRRTSMSRGWATTASAPERTRRCRSSPSNALQGRRADIGRSGRMVGGRRKPIR